MAKKTDDKKDKPNAVGRPNKMNPFLEKFGESMEVTEVAEKVIFLTDSELVFLINEELPEKDQISQRTFERWKAANAGEKQIDAEELDEVGAVFCRLYKKALIQQKAALFGKLTDKKEYAWQKWAWIIERKFDDWNIRHQIEGNHNVNQKQITIVKNYDNKEIDTNQ